MDPRARVKGSLDDPPWGQLIEGGQVRIRGWAFDERGPLDRVLVVVGELAPVTVTMGEW